MFPLILNILYGLAAVLYLPILLYRILVLRKDRAGWRERLGRVRPRVGTRPCILVHGVSLGEINATRSLVAEIERRLPKYEIVITATTQTGYDAAQRHYAPKVVCRYPLDFSWMVRRFFDRVRPAAVVLMELEVWPNFIREAARRDIPIGIANGRITEARSMRRFRLPIIRALARSMFSQLAWVAAQTRAYADRFAELGVEHARIDVTGTLKYDTAIVADTVDGADALAFALELDRDRPLWVAGSTGADEEPRLLDAYRRLLSAHPGVQFAIIPRHPERFDAVARLIESAGFPCLRRSTHPDLHGQDARQEQRRRRQRAGAARGTMSAPSASGDPPYIILGDTMGELRKFYALATVVFVGRTLVPLGGSDVMEIAGLAKPIVFGPHTENFADVVDALLAAGAAVRIQDVETLVATLSALLSDADRRAGLGRAARQVVLENVGATRRTVDLLCTSLGLRADHPETSIATPQIDLQSPVSSIGG